MAYAAVISLKYTIRYLTFPEYPESAYKDLESVSDILRRLDSSSNRSVDRNAINALDTEIREAAYKLEDALESYHLLRQGDEKGLLREIDLFSNTVKKLKVEYLRELENPSLPVQEDAYVSPIHDFGGNKSTTVGLWDQFEQIGDEILDLQSEPKVVSLVGMAGIGKTHLAAQIYHHPLIGEAFDFKVWFSVGPQQQVRNVWAEIVAIVEGEGRDLYMETNIITLVGILHKRLLGRGRCLIVLDDVWNSCDTLIRYLGGAEGDGRRILVTTRLEEVAIYHSTTIHYIRFFNSDESWKLLQLNVFGDEYFPPQLETAGRKIAENCEGLPLLILAIADILCGLDKTEEYWNKVADSKTTTFTEAYDRIEKVLFSSYEYLPQYLKACFLYMGVFPQKSEIPLPKLINLWKVEDVLDLQPSLIRTRKQATLLGSSPSKTRVASTSKTDPAFMGRMQSKTRRRITAKLDAGMEPKPSETSSASIAEIDAFMELTGSPTRVARTSENTALMEPKRIETCPQLSSERSCFKTCRHETMTPFESLYLLEPGPSPIRYIKPLDKGPFQFRWEPRRRSQTRKLNPPRFMDTSAPRVGTTPTGDAMECLKKLVSNSLTIVCKQSSDNKIKSCKLHSAYWHLCVKEARKNKFFLVLKKLTDASRDNIENQRRLSVQNNMLFGIKEVYDSMAATSTARSLLCTGPDQEYPVPICLNLMLLRVLDALAIRLYDFPAEVVKLLELRYLALTHNGKLPPSISKLQQLQYLIVGQHHSIEFLRDSTRLPKDMRNDIRDMHQMWSTNLLGDSTCLAKDIWEKICDVQQVWSSRLQGHSTCLTKEMWMQIWKLIWDMQQVRRAPLMRNKNYFSQKVVKEIEELWSSGSLRDLNCFPEEIWVDIWEKIWDVQQVWSTKLQRDSISLLKEIWEEIWGLYEVRSFLFLRGSTRLPKDMRNDIWDMHQVWSTNLLGDSTCSAKDIWEKICDVQQVWSSRLQGHSTCFTKEMWMQIWKLIWDMQQVRRAPLMRNKNYFSQKVVKEMQELWSSGSLRDLNCFPEEIWVDIWEKIWDVLQVWSTKLQRDSISLLKEIWEEIWGLHEVRSIKLLSDSTFLPEEIWDMQELRYLRIIGRNLPDPSNDTELPNLSTLHVNAHSCTYNVFKSIRFLKKLGIKIELQPDSAETLSCFKYIKLLDRLTLLKCVVVNPRLRSRVVAPPHHLSNLPSSLKKLSLNGLGYGWECMSVIGSLPKLEVLKLRCSAFQGPEWETKDEEFPILKYLLLEDMDVVRWTVDEDLCFPSLQHLIIQHCYRLKNLPGDIAALKTIQVVDCSPLVVASAQQTQQDRHPSVRVVITSSWSLRR